MSKTYRSHKDHQVLESSLFRPYVKGKKPRPAPSIEEGLEEWEEDQYNEKNNHE